MLCTIPYLSKGGSAPTGAPVALPGFITWRDLGDAIAPLVEAQFTLALADDDLVIGGVVARQANSADLLHVSILTKC